MVLKPSSRSSSQPALLSQLVRTVRQQRLFHPGHHILVAVSGGADSIALLSLLHRLADPWHLRLTVAHCNYGLRGAESDGDELFVSAFCQERELPLVIQRPMLAKRRQSSSLQAAARKARYDFMMQSAQEVGADRIAVGHTANDQAETILMWMLRGAGMAGLAGMPYVRGEKIVRPLLASTREDVLAYLELEGITYRLDSSNEKPIYHRNRIRRELLPLITQLAPAAIRVLQRQADLLREDEQYLEAVVRNLIRELVSYDSGSVQRLNRRAAMELPVALQRRLVRAVLRTFDGEGNASTVRVVESVRLALLKGRSGTRLSLKKVLVRVDQRSVRFSPVTEICESGPGSEQKKNECLNLSVPSTVYWAGTNQQIDVQHMTLRDAEQGRSALSAERVLFDADRFSEPLQVRPWQPGDRFFPQGMKGKSKKLQDFFTDRKIARHRRENIPLLVAPEGILWVVGMRQDERFIVTENTTSCLVVSVSDRVSEKE
jgi:tRNA(Ile)-lysidine synthase